MTPFISLSFNLSSLKIALGIRLPSPSNTIPGILIQFGSLSLEALYEFDDIRATINTTSYYKSSFSSGWIVEEVCSNPL